VISIDPEIMGGTAVFESTRVPFETLLDSIKAGQPLSEFLEDFPTITREQAVAGLEQAKEAPRPCASSLMTDPRRVAGPSNDCDVTICAITRIGLLRSGSAARARDSRCASRAIRPLRLGTIATMASTSEHRCPAKDCDSSERQERSRNDREGRCLDRGDERQRARHRDPGQPRVGPERRRGERKRKGY
jgi:uncharacterized protein (DUF433 family)